METLLIQLSCLFENLPDALRAHRRWVWPALILAALAIGSGVRWLTIEMTLESFFIEDDPVVVLHERFKDTFGSDEGVYIVYEARDGDVFSAESLSTLQALQTALADVSPSAQDGASSPLDHLLEVTSLINAPYLEVNGDSLVSRDFIGNSLPKTPAQRESLRRQALAHRDYPLAYLSEDSRYGGILLRTDFGAIPVDDIAPGDLEAGFSENTAEAAGESADGEPEGPTYRVSSMEEYSQFADALQAIFDDPAYTRALRFYPVGNPVAMGFFYKLIINELGQLFMATLGLMMLVLLVLFRSLSAVVWPLTVVALSALLTLGIVGWMGIPMSTMLSILMLLILVVGIADSVHILSGYIFFRRAAMEHQEALRAVMKKSGLACLLTSLTTAVGMLVLTLVPIQPIRNFGVAAAMGVTIAFLLTVTLLPLLLDIWRPATRREGASASDAGSPEKPPWAQRLLGRLEPFTHRFPLRVSVAFLLIGIVAGYGLSQIKVDSNLVTIVKEGTTLRTAYTLVDRVMGGSQNMEILLEFGTEDALKDPEVLAAMESMQAWLENEQGEFVVKTDSLVRVVKSAYQALNEDRREMYRIPGERNALAQTLLLFDAADPEERAKLVPDDYSQGRISVRLVNRGSSAYLELFDQVQEQLDEIFSPLKKNYAGLTYGLTGGLPLIMQMADYMSYSQIRSFGLVLIVVTMMLCVVFGSVKVGLVAMLPNVFPVLVTFGMMGLAGIPLDVDTLIIAPIVIGIAVDDTIHFLSHYRADFVETSRVVESIVNTLREVGQALIFTTLILLIGLFALTTSTHQGIANFGVLAAVAFVSALLADLLLLPSLLVLFNIRFEGRAADA